MNNVKTDLMAGFVCFFGLVAIMAIMKEQCMFLDDFLSRPAASRSFPLVAGQEMQHYLKIQGFILFYTQNRIMVRFRGAGSSW